MVGIVSYLAIDGLHDGMGFAADQDFAAEVGVGERGEGVEETFPAGFPLGEELVAGCSGGFEFGVAAAVGLFAVGGEEVRPAGAHISVEMFDDDGDGIRLSIKGDGQRLVRSLRDGAFAEVFVIAEQAGSVEEVGVCELVRHAGILHRLGLGSNSWMGACDESGVYRWFAGLHADDFVGYTPPRLQLGTKGRDG